MAFAAWAAQACAPIAARVSLSSRTDGASSRTFWLRRCSEHSRSLRSRKVRLLGLATLHFADGASGCDALGPHYEHVLQVDDVAMIVGEDLCEVIQL